MIFKHKPNLQRAWEESVDSSRTNCSLFAAIADVHTGNQWPVKCTLCSPEFFTYLSLAHLHTWISTITLIYSSRTRRHSEVHKIWLTCCWPVSCFLQEFSTTGHQEKQGINFIVGTYMQTPGFSFNWPGRWCLLTERMSHQRHHNCFPFFKCHSPWLFAGGRMRIGDQSYFH